MTALTTSLALPLFNVVSVYEGDVWLPGLERMVLRAVYKCMKEQYWK
tara:strand:+ start:289 stop:429 length:141 start_codon:yes stop_codon:yes gene_type:complete